LEDLVVDGRIILECVFNRWLSNRTHLDQDGALVNSVMNLTFPYKAMDLLTSWATISFSVTLLLEVNDLSKCREVQWQELPQRLTSRRIHWTVRRTEREAAHSSHLVSKLLNVWQYLRRPSRDCMARGVTVARR